MYLNKDPKYNQIIRILVVNYMKNILGHLHVVKLYTLQIVGQDVQMSCLALK